MIALAAACLLALSPLDQAAPCRGCSKTVVREDKRDLLVFISSSAPLETWKDFSRQMEKTGGVFVLRGIPGGSFEAFALKVMELRQAGVSAPIDIDPDLFEQFEVIEVPTVVLCGKKSDRSVGNLRLSAILELMAESGDENEKASALLRRLK